MLIRFHVSNYLSFNEEVEFSMIPSKVQQHSDHIVQDNIDILKTGVIYGSNASGKSNLIKSMDFAKKLIVDGTKAKSLIPRNHFKLDTTSKEKISKFEFEFKQDDNFYIYGFEIDTNKVYSEWLYEIKKTTEKMLFERETSDDGKTKIEFGIFRKNATQKKKEFFDFVAQGTRPNQLFLTESIERNILDFQEVHDWFSEQLTIIFPDTKYFSLPHRIQKQDNMIKSLEDILEQLGTGICGFKLENVSPEEIQIPDKVLQDIREELLNSKKNIVINLMNHYNNSRYVCDLDDDQNIKISKLMFKHKSTTCQDEILMEPNEESDGTLRLLDLLPLLYNSTSNDKVYVIDELDRSLHPNLSYELIKLFLQNNKSKSQLIVTTHESGLLNLDLLRRDEIWFVEKDKTGASKVYSLEEFTPRYDSDIRKGYLLGRYGAIPILGNVAFLEK